MHHRHHAMIGQRNDYRTLMSQPSVATGSPRRWTQLLVLSLSVLYSIRSWYHPTDLLEEQFHKEREETRREVRQKRPIGKATPDDSHFLQPLVDSKSSQRDHHNFLFHADNPSTTLWQELPDWAASYFEWHATQRVVGSPSTLFLLYDPHEDQFLSFYDVLWLAAQTKRLLLIHQQWLEPASLLDWKIPTKTSQWQWPTQPVSPYHNIHDDPSRSLLVHRVLPDMDAPHQHRHERRRAVRAVWKALFKPKQKLQDHVATVIQERLENRPYTAILWNNNNAAPSLLRTIHCAHWLWEQAHHHDTQPMVYLITNHTAPMDVAPLVVADSLNNHDSMFQLLVHTYVASGADCLVYAGASSTVATRLSETSCRWRYDGGSVQCPVNQ